MSNDKGWYGVDLDRTLAFFDHWRGPEHIGEPIPEMLERVKGWLKEGREVRIFTARVYHDGTPGRIREANHARIAIYDWCWKYFGLHLLVTNVKDYDMIELWDDRARQVEENTGRLIGDVV